MFEGIVDQIRGKKAAELEQKQINKQQKYQRESDTFAQNAGTDEVSFNALQSDKSDLLRWQQDLSDEEILLINTLLGYYKDKEGNWTPIMVAGKPKQPLCNTLFIHDIVISQVRPFLSRVMANTNYSEKNINVQLKETGKAIKDNMSDFYDKYGIDFLNFDVILRMILNLMKSSAYRALNGWTKKEDSRIHKRIETSTLSQKDTSNNNILAKGIFSSG